jgi:hypothetical protein
MRKYRDGAGSVDAAAAASTHATPGKSTLSDGLTVQRKESAATPGKSTLSEGLAVQRKELVDGTPSIFQLFSPPVVQMGGGGNGAAPGAVHEAAARGTATPSTALPHADKIQASFGAAHDVSGIQAHVGGDATEACHDMGASAFASGNQVAFAGQPDLHTAAHEAAHVVQQARGVNLYGGVGSANDSYEQHADAVADRVVAGQSAADLLGSTGSGGATAAVQRKDDIHTEKISETTDTGNKYTQELNLNKTTGRVQIQLGINWVQQGTWTDDTAFQTFVRSAKTAVYGYVDNKFKIICTPSASDVGTAKPAELTIDFLLYDIDSGYKIECFGNQHGRSAMTQAGGKLYELGQTTETTLPPITVAHEFGHCLLGASDEYANSAAPGRTLTNDHSIMANYYAQGVAQAEFKVRHFDHILKTVAAQYPGYTCSLK